MKSEARAECINNAKNYILSVKKSIEVIEDNLNSDDENTQDIGGAQATAIKLCLDNYIKHLENIIGVSIKSSNGGNFYEK